MSINGTDPIVGGLREGGGRFWGDLGGGGAFLGGFKGGR